MSSGTRRRLPAAAAALLALVTAAAPAAEVLHDHSHGWGAECPVCEGSPTPDGVRCDGAALPAERDTASPGLAETDAGTAPPALPRSQGARAPPA